MTKDGAVGRVPPPLPPRTSTAYNDVSGGTEDDVPPPPYEPIAVEPSTKEYISLARNDPRSSSTESLLPTKADQNSDKRKLLLIYVHGFMGNETSFQSFPAHVHSLVTALVAETHTVHTKLYPRYRSKKKIAYARDDFSRWLAPHEMSTTDIILLGHSMGGLLSAEVALNTSDVGYGLRHRLIGTINFDVPFLGMHPRVVKSGLASIFSPAPEPPKSPHGSISGGLDSSSVSAQQQGNYFADRPSPASPSVQSTASFSPMPLDQHDPNYNPAFDNDVNLQFRKGWRNAWHFVNKHHDNLTAATKQLVKSHLEFGGAMADYSTLKSRYARIRALEEQNLKVRNSVLGGSDICPRVRFVNYYTSATGRPPKPKSPLPSTPDANLMTKALEDARLQESTTTGTEDNVHDTAPNLNLDLSGDEDARSLSEDLNEQTSRMSMDQLEPGPMSDTEKGLSDTSDAEPWVDAAEDLNTAHANGAATDAEDTKPLASDESHVATTTPAINDSSIALPADQSLPPVPDLPRRPVSPDFATFPDKDTRKLAEKEHGRAVKGYERAVKEREKALKDRKKLEEKRQRNAIKEGKKAEKNREKDSKKEGKQREKVLERSATDQEKALSVEQKDAEREWKQALNQKWNDDDSSVQPHTRQGSMTPSMLLSPQMSNQGLLDNKPLKDRPFCSLPPKDGSGIRDPTWVRIVMKDVDEVGAHCGLFFPDERYERLVGDVGERISNWVSEAESERVIMEMGAYE